MCGPRSRNWKRLVVTERPSQRLPMEHRLKRPQNPRPNQLRKEPPPRPEDRPTHSRDKPMDNTRPIIVIKKKSGHAGHHGGAWKVAYADFVTAMMALFIVLWLLNTSKKVQEAVGGYFKDPTGNSKTIGSNMSGSGENFTLTRDNMPKLKEELQNALKQMADFERLKSHVEMTVTAEGLRIELSEAASGTFFA